MNKDLNIVQELQQIAPGLIGLQQNPYNVSVNYFDNLAQDILLNIDNEVFIQNIAAPKYQVPEGYFTGLANNILAKIKEAQPSVFEPELVEIAPLLSSISKQNIYTVPLNYFGTLHIAPPVQHTKVISMGSKKRWIKYAVAAAITGFLAVGGYIFYGKNEIKQQYQAAIITNINQSLEQLSGPELEKGIENTKAFYALTDNVSNGAEDLPTVEESIEFLSDEELEQYLNTNTTIAAEDVSGS